MTVIQGLNAPIGSLITDAGTLARAANKQLLDGSTFALSETAKYTAWKQAGYAGALEASFNTSATASTNNMTSNSLPAGYTASATYGTNPYKLRDGDSATYFSATGLRNVITFGFPTQSIGGFKLKSKSPWGSTMVTSGNVQIMLDDVVLDTVSIFHARYTNDQEVTFSCNVPVGQANKFVINVEGVGGEDDAIYYMGDLSILPLDLSVIKCTHGLTTGDAVRVGTTGTIPTGLTKDTVTYYLREGADANKCTLYDTEAHAIAGGATGLITLTDAGSGTFFIYPETITLSTVSNSYFTY